MSSENQVCLGKYSTTVNSEQMCILFFLERQYSAHRFKKRFQLVSWLSMPFCTSLSSCVQHFFPVSFLFITHNLISELIRFLFCFHCVFVVFCFLCMYGLLGLLLTSGENILSSAPLEIYLLRKMVMHIFKGE